MSLTIVDNQVETAIRRLLYQFKDKPNFEAFVTAFVQQFQDIEDVIGQLLTDRQVDTATGENLNILGRIVGQPREGRTDADYRIWIKARIQINKSSGLTEEIYNVLKLITGFMDVGDFQIEELDYPASFFMTINPALESLDPQIIYDVIDEMRSACIAFSIFYHITDPVFAFDVGPGFDQGHLAGIV